MNGSLNAVSSLSDVFVFPHSYDCPSGVDQLDIGCPIPAHVRLQFGQPPITIGLRHSAMDGTLMPEAAIDEYGYSLSCESDINTLATTHNGKVDTKSKSPSPQF
jgi:hypothetical protein